MAHPPSQPAAIPPLSVGPSLPLQQKFDVLSDWLDRLHSGGAFNGTVLISEGDRVCFERHCGYSDLAGTIPLSGHTSYSLASMSKPFTALGILLLIQKQKLTLEDKLARHIPELAAYGEITVRQMMHHISGIPDHMELADEVWPQSKILTIEDLIGLFQKYRPRAYFAPGDQFEYSNTGYVLLGEIIARTSGRSYPEFMAGEIFKPLGMNDSAAFNLSSKECPLRQRAFGFRKEFGKNLLCDLNFLDGVFGDGGIYSSADDLVRWDRALRQGALLPNEVYEQAYVSGRLNSGKITGYGFGWEIRPSNVVDHMGQWEGFTSFVRRDLKRNSLLVILSNLGPSNRVDPICAEINEFVGGI